MLASNRGIGSACAASIGSIPTSVEPLVATLAVGRGMMIYMAVAIKESTIAEVGTVDPAAAVDIGMAIEAMRAMAILVATEKGSKKRPYAPRF